MVHLRCGLRDTPTLLSNMMLPFGNLITYLKLPDWIQDWDNIPEENDDDADDVKAFKRFLAGDDEYRNLRTYIVPHIVDGPLAVRLIKPPPVQVLIDGPRHPAKWTKHSKRVDPRTGKSNAALMEVDVDLLTNKRIRQIISIVRPHLASITIDLALVIAAPKESEVEEVSLNVCLI